MVAVFFGITSCTIPSKVKSNVNSNNKKDQSFIIDGADFKIDQAKSSFKIDLSNREKPLITIEVFGHEKTFEKLSEPEKCNSLAKVSNIFNSQIYIVCLCFVIYNDFILSKNLD